MLQQLLTTAKPGWRIKIDPNLSVATGNTHPRMVQYKGKLLTIACTGRYYVSVKEDGGDFLPSLDISSVVSGSRSLINVDFPTFGSPEINSLTPDIRPPLCD